MRIANLVPAGYSEGFQPSEELIGDGVTVDPIEMKLPALPGNKLDLALTDVATVEAAYRAEAAGYDAMFVNSVADYGLGAVRAAVRVPAIGAGQASMLLACQLGRRFSIVSVLSPALRECHEAQLREYELSDRCASMRFVVSEEEMLKIAEPDSWYERMRSRRSDMIERIGNDVRAAVEEDGADAIVLGCTCMAPAASALAELADAPVINPLDAVFVQIESLVRLGLSQSPRAYLPAPVERHAAFAGMAAGAQIALPELGGDPNCEVCVTIAEEEPAPAQS